MNKTTSYILDLVKKNVWSGFYSPEEVDAMIDDVLEDDADEEFLRSSVTLEFERKSDEEKTWPAETDCDRLDAVFQALEAQGIIAEQNAGYTMSDGLHEVGEAWHRGGKNARGYCFYHGQDLERAVEGGGLNIAFGSFNNSKVDKENIGRVIRAAFEEFGFTVVWDKNPETRLELPDINWQRRLPS